MQRTYRSVSTVISASIIVTAALAAAALASLQQSQPAAPSGAATPTTAPTIRIMPAGRTPASRPASKPVDKSSPAAQAFEKIKSLAGKWVMEPPGAPADQPVPPEAVKPQRSVIYRVTSNGNAVQETLAPSSESEMVTMFHIDGDSLLLTHYCTLGNQPHMRATKLDDPNRLDFVFDGGTNLDPAKDPHMHNLTITFIDADHVKADWTFYRDGKSSHIKTFNWRRVPDQPAQP